jgi:hypothetical protein
MVDKCIIMLTPTAATRKEVGKLMETALGLSEEGKWMIDAWIEDANGILAFVSPDLLIRQLIILMRGF